MSSFMIVGPATDRVQQVRAEHGLYRVDGSKKETLVGQFSQIFPHLPFDKSEVEEFLFAYRYVGVAALQNSCNRTSILWTRCSRAVLPLKTKPKFSLLPRSISTR